VISPGSSFIFVLLIARYIIPCTIPAVPVTIPVIMKSFNVAIMICGAPFNINILKIAG
jgi:hypothetical protein